MDVSVIIVNYNTSALLRNCLRSIIGKTVSVRYEIIVVDNASSDDSVRMVKEHFPGVRLIESETNLGFGRANNLGSARASGKYVFFLNSDTELCNNAIQLLFTFMEAHPECGIAGGNLVDQEGRPSHSFRRSLPSPHSELYRFAPALVRVMEGRNWYYNHSGEPMKVGYITGADLMMRRDLFEGIGAFDPDFFMYYEETELTQRVRRSGHTVWSVPAAQIMHLKGASLEFVSDTKTLVYKSKYLYMRKAFGAHAALRAHVFFQGFCFYKLILHTLFGRKSGKERYWRMSRLDRQTYHE